MNYLLDTKVCLALINGDSGSVRRRFEGAMEAGDNLYLSSIVAFELWYGVAKSSRMDRNKASLNEFLSSPIQVIAFDDQDAQAAGMQRAALEKVGPPIGAYDLLLAGQALRRAWTLVTANASEFSRIKDLRWEDWAKG